MLDLTSRLAQGPLKVGSLWTPERPALVARRALRRRRMAVSLAATCACLCFAVLLFLPWRDKAAPAAATAGDVRFTDGSAAKLADNGTQLRVEEDTPQRVVARLTGGARFDVVPNPTRTFEVRSGDVRVRVLGTAFSVRQVEAGRSRISVEHGRVHVAWLGGATLLADGQDGVFPPAAENEPEAKAVDPSPQPSAGPRTEKGWRELALKGDFDKAYADLDARGKDDVRDEPSDLMLAADVARLSSHPAQAVGPLRKLCDRYPRDKRAPVAAFTLGRVLLDDLGRASDAAAAFRKARTLWPSGPLAEDALAREAEACERSGRGERARALADEYLKRYPIGRHSAAMGKTLGR
jgi:transmembrane sensor